MGKLVKLDDYRFPYRTVLTVDRGTSRLEAFINDNTGDLEVVQSNGEGDAVTTVLTAGDVACLLSNLAAPVRARR